jgi:hypothetical protein
MNTNRILLAGLVGGVFAFFVGWLIFGILFKDMMPEGMSGVLRKEEDMIIWAIALSNILWAVTIAYIFVQWANISTWQAGVMAGAILGFLITASFDFGFYSMTTLFTIQEVIIDVLINTIWVAIMGAVIGWWLGWKK